MKKSVILISVPFFILFASCALYVHSKAFSDRIRPVVAAYLEETLGPGTVVGSVKAGLIPPYLEVRDVAILDDRGVPALAIRKARAYVNPLPLILGRVSLPSVSVLEPRLSLERSGNGSWNFSRLLERLRSPQPSRQKAPSALSVKLHSLNIRNGAVTFIDTPSASRSLITGLTMSLHGDVADGDVRLAVDKADIGISTATTPELHAALKTDCYYHQGRLTIDAFALSARDAWITVSGTMGKLPEGALRLKIRSRIGAPAIGKIAGALGATGGKLPPFADIAAEARGTVSDPVLEGSLNVNGVSVQGITLKNAALAFEYRSGKLAVAGEKWKLAREKGGVLIGDIRSSVEYRDGGLNIHELSISSQGLEARVIGRVDFKNGYDAALTLGSTSENRAFSVLTAVPLAGKIGMEGRITGALSAPRFDGTVSAGPLTVRGVLFTSVQGNLVCQGKKITLSETEIRQQGSRYAFDGSVDFSGKEPRYEARLDVIRSDVVSVVSLFYKPLPLQLSAKGELSFTGTASSYSGAVFLSLDAGKAYGESFDSGTLKASLSTGRISFPQVVLYKGSGVVKGDGWIGFDGTYDASVQSRYVDLSEVDLVRSVPLSGLFKLDIESSGSFAAPFVHAALDVPELSYNTVAVGETAAVLEISNHALAFTGSVSENRAELAGKITLQEPYPWSASFSVHADRIDPFAALGKRELMSRVQLAVDGTVTASGAGIDGARLSAVAAFPRLQLAIGDYRIGNEKPAGFTINAGRLKITSLEFTGPATRLAVSGGARLKKDMDVALSGSANLSLLRLLYPEVELGDGPIELKLAVREKWSNPDVYGELDIGNGTLKIRDIPQKFTALAGKVTFSEGRLLVDSLTGEMGGGSLHLSGSLQLTGITLSDFSFKAAGAGVTVRYPEGVTSTLSGELFYEGNRAEQTLSGDVAIKQARYEKRVEWKTMLLEMARGLYQKKKTDVGWIGDTQLNIRFHGKEGILFQNNLAKIPLDADVQLRGTINRLQLVGRLEARTGVVYFRNNEFRILHASADFVDPTRLNPILDIQAETRVRDYLVRLSVTGAADRAVVAFMSDPPLTDPDILGMLALGKTGTELKGKGTGVGMGEAVSFATGQFQDIFEQRARSLTGLDRFQVDPYVSKGDTSVPRVTVGKELVRDKLYVTYSSNVGASSSEPVLKVEYLLNRNLSFVGEQNELGKIGADVKFRFEFK